MVNSTLGGLLPGEEAIEAGLLRRARALGLAALLGWLVTAPIAAADQGEQLAKTAPRRSPPGAVEFKSVLDLHQSPPPFQPQLRGGQEAVSADWPASLYFDFKDTDGDSASCSAVLIGPKVILTAAHCVPPDLSISWAPAGAPKPYQGQCAIPDHYAVDESADFGICVLKEAYKAPPGFLYETVQLSNMDALVGPANYVLLTGFGCTSDLAADQDKRDGKYRIGYGLVVESSRSTTRSKGPYFYAGSQENNLFTADDGTSAHANVCPGDSGGPAFLVTAGPGIAHRVVVAVNSRVFYDRSGLRFAGSILSATGGPDFQAFAIGALHGEPACGVSGALPNCRS